MAAMLLNSQQLWLPHKTYIWKSHTVANHFDDIAQIVKVAVTDRNLVN